MTHDSESCYTLKNKAKVDGKLPAKKAFTNKGLRKEINVLAQHSSKEKVFDLYAKVISKEKAKLKRDKQRTNQKPVDMDTDSGSDADTEMSTACIECASKSDHEEDERAHNLNEEEMAFLTKL